MHGLAPELKLNDNRPTATNPAADFFQQHEALEKYTESRGAPQGQIPIE